MSAVIKRSVAIQGHRTSFSLEQPFYDELVAIADQRGMAIAALVGEIDKARPDGINLSSALRLHELKELKAELKRT